MKLMIETFFWNGNFQDYQNDVVQTFPRLYIQILIPKGSQNDRQTLNICILKWDEGDKVN